MTEQTVVVARRATCRDVLDAPEPMVAEIIGGALHLHPRPRSRHARVAFVPGRLVGGPFHYDPADPGGWRVLDEPELHLGDDVLVPDIAVWRRERMPALEDVAHFEAAPDWVCEVLSPATRARARGPERDLYGARGVGHLRHVDPGDRRVEAFGRQGGALRASSPAVRSAPRPGCARDDRRGVPRLIAGGQDRVALPPFEAVDLAPPRLPSVPEEAAPDER